MRRGLYFRPARRRLKNRLAALAFRWVWTRIPSALGPSDRFLQTRWGPGYPGPPSRPGEFHPEPLTEPYVRLSPHTARATHRRLPPSGEDAGFLRLPVDPAASPRVTHPLRPTGITPFHRYWAVRTWSGPSVLSASRDHRLCLSLGMGPARISGSTRKPRLRVTPPEHLRCRPRSFRCVIRRSLALVSLIHT